MAEKLTGVIKSQMVRQVGTLAVGNGPMMSSPAGAKARIIEQKDGSAVIEVTCGCGKRIYVECEY
ncbi:MAG: hypothetical protein EHM48_01890 [Planctomycetaceae bacterium]|nr:MAG: hypothetical protein EHM48_01890 [Planctomycetaceae bacterium]